MATRTDENMNKNSVNSGGNGGTSQAKPIALVGSASTISEFFYYGINQILYQRGIYPPESFNRFTKYGMTTLVTSDAAIEKYLQAVLSQMNVWLSRCNLRRVVVVIASVATNQVLERWAFDVLLNHEDTQKGFVEKGLTPSEGQCDRVAADAESANKKENEKIVAEIRALLTQITATVSILPLLDQACSFDVLIYTTEDAETPVKWLESSARTIPNAQNVQLRSFATSVHNVDTNVSFASQPSV